MNAADLTYGKMSEVADTLMQADRVGVPDLTAALINALNRIEALEKRGSIDSAFNNWYRANHAEVEDASRGSLYRAFLAGSRIGTL